MLVGALAFALAVQDPNSTDKTVDKAAAWLLTQKFESWPFGEGRICRFDDFVLYTFLHAGVDRTHPKFQALLKNILESRLETTYCVAFQAMALSELDSVQYQARLAECAQFLVDTQCTNGQWSYGKVMAADWKPEGARSSPDPAAKPGRPKKRIALRRSLKAYRETGDNSNSQYAALGLRACLEANVAPPGETLKLAKKSWEGMQNKDGGWGYEGAGSESYGSMTAGALASLILYRHYLQEEWESHPVVTKGIQWLADHFTVKEHANWKGEQAWFYYYLYSIERLGMLSGAARFGDHDWYRSGTEELIRRQHGDGYWLEPNTTGGGVKDTCFAILFLRKATIPLPKIATRDK